MQGRNASVDGAPASLAGGQHSGTHGMGRGHGSASVGRHDEPHGTTKGCGTASDVRFSTRQSDASTSNLRPSSRAADVRFSHPRMPMSERAKIFVPFNPLKGFSEALRAKEREVEAAALDDRGGNDLEAPDEASTLEEYLTAEDVADGAGPSGGMPS